MLPFSFQEFLSLQDVKVGKSSYDDSRLIALAKEYLSLGSFPQVLLQPAFREEFYREYIRTILYRDVVERYNIRNVTVARYFLKALLSSIGRPFNIHKVYRELKSVGLTVSKNTLYEYYRYFMDTMAFYGIRKLSPSLRDRERTFPKIYGADHAFVEGAKALENAVFVELLRRGYDVGYLSNGYEVDFIVEGRRIQVSYSLEESWERELRPLRKGDCVITLAEEGQRDGIHIVPFHKFSLHGGKLC